MTTTTTTTKECVMMLLGGGGGHVNKILGTVKVVGSLSERERKRMRK